MLVNSLKFRELGGVGKMGVKCENILKVLFANKMRRRQKLNTFFPVLGSTDSVIVLGFTSCGNFVITMDGVYVSFFALRLSRQLLSVAYLHMKLTIRDTVANLTDDCAFLEIIHLRDNPLRLVATLTSELEDLGENEDITIGRLALHWQGNMFYDHSEIPLSMKNNALFSVNSTDDSILFVNGGISMNVFVVHQSKHQLSTYLTSSCIAFNNILEKYDVELFVSESHKGATHVTVDSTNEDIKWWYAKSSIVESTTDQEQPQIQQSCITEKTKCPFVSHICLKLDMLAVRILRHYHRPTLYKRANGGCIIDGSNGSNGVGSNGSNGYMEGSLIDLEHRIVGPCDAIHGLQYLVIIAVTFTHRAKGQQSMSFLSVLSPLIGRIAVLKVCDLALLCTTERVRFSLFCKSAASVQRISPSWLCCAVDFYYAIVRKAYCSLHGKRNLGVKDIINNLTQRLDNHNSHRLRSIGTKPDDDESYSNSNGGVGVGCNDSTTVEDDLKEFCVLSNYAMIMKGESVTTLTHPVVPIVVYKDEDEEGGGEDDNEDNE